jgi:serine/threonine protein kinase
VLQSEFPESDRFDIEQSLGQGGYGVVYRAYDRHRHTHVALKLLARPNISDLYRFKQEFRALADLSHPHLVSLYELLFERGHWFIVMELVEGTDFISHVSTNVGRGQQLPAPDHQEAPRDPTIDSVTERPQRSLRMCSLRPTVASRCSTSDW